MSEAGLRRRLGGMNTTRSSLLRWLPLTALALSWIALWLTGVWLKPPRPDEAIAVVRVNDTYLDGRRFTCDHLSASMSFDLACSLGTSAGVLKIVVRTNDGTDCAATMGDARLTCVVRGFGYFNRLALVTAPPEVAAALAPGDFTLVGLGLSEQAWVPIGFGVLGITSLLALATAWAWTPRTRWQPLTAMLLTLALWPLNAIIVVANFAGLSMID